MNGNVLETVWAPRVLSILRIVAALLLIAHGTQKLFNFPPSEYPSPAFMSLFWIAGALEIVGGLALLLGLFPVCASLFLSGTEKKPGSI
jgi:putative oxidoreductase